MSSRSEIAGLALVFGLLPFTSQGAEKPLEHTSEVRRMSSTDAARGLPLRISGVVTALSGWKNSFFLQDSEGGISVDRTDSAEVRAGDLVEVVGVTGAGMFAPVVKAREVVVLSRHGAFPAARPAQFGDLANGKLDSQRIEIRGVVHSAVISSSWGRPVLFLDADVDGQTITARVREFKGNDFKNLLDATVLIRGVSGTIFNEKRQFRGVRLFVPSLRDVIVEEKGVADPFSLPELSFEKLLQFDPARSMIHRVHISGVLTGERAGRTLYLQQGKHGMAVKVEQPVFAPIGSRVEAAGFVRGSDDSPTLYNAVVRVMGKSALPTPLQLKASKAIEVRDGFAFASASGLLVRMEGDVIDRLDRKDQRIWILRDGNRLFEAHLQAPADSGRNSGVENGSRVQVEGVFVVEMGDQLEPQSFHILMRTQEDIRVKSAPLVTVGRLIWLALATALLSIGAVILAFRTKNSGAEPRAEASQGSDRMRERCHGYARAAGLIGAGTGLVVLIGGWMLDFPRLRTILNGYSAMRPLTALGLFFAGLSLYLDRQGQSTPLRRTAVRTLAALTAAVGFLPFAESWLHRDFHLDRILVPHHLLTAAPGQMAIFTALNFVMIAGCSFLSGTRRWFGVGQCLAILAGSLSLFNAIGFLYGIKTVLRLTANAGPTFTTAMAIHTAVAMILLSAGALLSRPSWGLMITLTSNAPGGVIGRRLLPCAAIIPVVGWLRLQGEVRGLYDETLGLTLFASANMIIILFLNLRNCSLLNRSDVERSRAERSLRASEKSFRNLTEAMPRSSGPQRPMESRTTTTSAGTTTPE